MRRGLAGQASSTPATHFLRRANVMTLHDPRETKPTRRRTIRAS
jgi:hypothetical protein